MSFMQCADAMNASELQVWNNAAFDIDEVPTKALWSSLHPVFENPSESLDSDRSKENLSPVMANSPVSVKSSIPIKPLHSNGVIGNSISQRKSAKILAKKACEQEDDKKIDAEIEEIENEIKRLSSRLEALRLEKAQRIAKTTIEKRGRVVPAKFMEAKQSVKKVEETPFSSSVKSKFNRRGVSLGPAEIFAEAKFRPPGKLETTPGPATQSVKKIEEPSLSSSVKSKIDRRGMSLGPSEIFATARLRPPGKLEMTPGPATQSRRKSCFMQPQDIEESKSAIRDRRKSMTVSPKSRKTGKIESQKQAATTTVGSKKLVKKESSLIQPRKLFKDSEKEKSVSTKKPLKPGRVVASRYNMISSNQSCGAAIEAARKRSLPENEKEEGLKKARGSEGITEGGRVKKRWEIPSRIVLDKRREEEEEEENTLSMTDLLPKIKTTRCVDESPRGSGPAKRVADLKGKKRSYFCPDNEDDDEYEDEVAGSPCEAVSFVEQECDNDEDDDET